MVSGVSGSAPGSAGAKVSFDIQAATVKKALDVQKQQGDAALQLLQSATQAEPGSPGGLIDTKA
ncbi:MAG: YjfB family protein [Nitrospinae bacterium]|nr:YjfB family protein [Nitrospinota bacterium]MBI5428522.1 YjfB family protein [Nitrospinota bacterium]